MESEDNRYRVNCRTTSCSNSWHHRDCLTLEQYTMISSRPSRFHTCSATDTDQPQQLSQPDCCMSWKDELWSPVIHWDRQYTKKQVGSEEAQLSFFTLLPGCLLRRRNLKVAAAAANKAKLPKASSTKFMTSTSYTASPALHRKLFCHKHPQKGKSTRPSHEATAIPVTLSNM